jgi:hypothetical protein
MVQLHEEYLNSLIEGTIIDIETIGNFNDYPDSRRYIPVTAAEMIAVRYSRSFSMPSLTFEMRASMRAVSRHFCTVCHRIDKINEIIWKYSLSYIAKKLKRMSSRVLREEFPHLREWCGEHLWAPRCPCDPRYRVSVSFTCYENKKYVIDISIKSKIFIT